MRRISYILVIFFTTNFYSQIDLNKSNDVVSEKFNPRVLMFLDEFLFTHAYNENTLYLIGGKKIKVFSSRGLGIVTALADKKEDFVAISNYHKTINIHTLEEPSLVKTINTKDVIAHALQLKNGKLYAGLSNGDILVDSINSTDEIKIKAHEDIIRDIKTIDDLLISVSHDGFVKIWRIDSNIELLQTVELNKVLTKIAISPDKSKIAIGCFDGSIFVLDRQFNISKEIEPHNNIITQLKFEDNNTIISSSFDKRIISTNIKKEKYSVLYMANEHITNFDIRENRFVYSCRNGEIYYYNNLANK